MTILSKERRKEIGIALRIARRDASDGIQFSHERVVDLIGMFEDTKYHLSSAEDLALIDNYSQSELARASLHESIDGYRAEIGKLQSVVQAACDYVRGVGEVGVDSSERFNELARQCGKYQMACAALDPKP